MVNGGTFLGTRWELSRPQYRLSSVDETRNTTRTRRRGRWERRLCGIAAPQGHRTGWCRRLL
jgi:hypothetical protein